MLLKIQIYFLFKMKNQFFTKIYLKQGVYNNLTLFNKDSINK